MVAIVHPKLAQASFERAIRPLLTQPETYEKAGVRLVAYRFPHLDVELDWHAQRRAILLRVAGTDFPYRPVSGGWITATGERLLPGSGLVPVGQGFHHLDTANQPGPWFCFKGWREYHDHPGHQDVNFASIRREKGHSVLQLIQQLHTNLNNSGATLV